VSAKVNGSEEFWALVVKCGPDECWVWKGHCRTSGYGHFTINYRSYRAHRLAYLFAYRHLGRRDIVRHSCDNPPCCNPKHLVVGTNKENTRDMLNRGRCNPPVGMRSASSKLCDYQILEIRKLAGMGIAQLEIIRTLGLGVNQSQISRIVSGKTWKHL